ncbi:MAG: cobalamin B12-binding domain-containing protein [Alphaproteobacteria bacterium]|nr:cobalamin B12-binding domain-containing protein [Alphaproteobacteria bacterium]
MNTETAKAPPTRSLRVAIISLYALENNGVRHVASSLRDEGFAVTEVYFKDWVNNRFPWPTEQEVVDLIELLREREVGIVGFSVRASAFHRMAKYLTERVRAALGLPILWGGMHPTFLPEMCIEIADYIAVGEVDDAVRGFFVALDEGRPVHRCPSFWVREGDTVYKNDLAPLVDLDAIPFRDFHTQDDKFHVELGKVSNGDPFITNPEYTLLASRGCPYWTCTFCSNTLTKPLYEGLGKSFRVRSVEHIIQEMEYAKQLCTNIKVVRFDDEVFPIRADWIEEFAEKWPARVGIPFEVLVDPRMVTYKSLKRLKDAGLRAICMGIQANDRVNQEFYNRNTTNQQILDAQEVFRAVDIQSNLQIIWDDPCSTEEDKDQLFRMIMELKRPFELYLFGLTIYPHTHLARRLLREGRITEEDIEGVNTHAFEQFRVDLNYPRPKEDKRWLALIVLSNKPFISKETVWRLYKNDYFKENPQPLVAMAQAANLLRMSMYASGMVLRGEMTPLLLKRWVNPRSMVTM